MNYKKDVIHKYNYKNYRKVVNLNNIFAQGNKIRKMIKMNKKQLLGNKFKDKFMIDQSLYLNISTKLYYSIYYIRDYL